MATQEQSQKTTRTRILIISDTHTAMLDQAPPAADLAIHCGDLTYTGELEEYHAALDMLQQIDAPVKLVIAGNHDLTLDREFVTSHLGQLGMDREDGKGIVKTMRALWTEKESRAKRESVTFLDEGVHDVALANGASVRVYASPYTPEFCDWGFPYRHFEDRFNHPGEELADAKNIAVQPIPSINEPGQRPLDVVITHGPPYGRLDTTTGGESVGCLHLLRAVMRARPLIHCFGHIHEGRGAEMVRWGGRVDEVAAEKVAIAKWRDGLGEAGVEVKEEHGKEGLVKGATAVDVSAEGGKGIRRGEETVSLVSLARGF